MVLISDKHFTQDTYVVYKKPTVKSYPQTHIVSEIKRGLSYTDAIRLSYMLNRDDDALPRNVAGVKENLYLYMEQEEFDENQNEVRKHLEQGVQESLF